MRTTDLRDLMLTVEQVRSEKHPSLDPTFLEAVITAEEQNPEDDNEALRCIQVALSVVLVTSPEV